MSGEALYERYKDALKRGHVAALRGRLTDALDAYGEAAEIAPERPSPHTSAGTALLRRKRVPEALLHYTAALQIAPHDEAALLGRAQALAALDRRLEAADAFDTLSEARAATGKLADAVDAARRGLELAEGRDRRRTLERLIRRLRESEPGEPGRLALERALLILDGPAVSNAPAREGAADVGDAAGDIASPAEDAAAHRRGAAAAGIAAVRPGGTVEAGAEVASQPSDGVRPVDAAGAPVPTRSYRPALDRDLAPEADATALALLAEAALEAGDPGPALDRLLDLAAAYRRDDHIDGALDACYVALSIDPDDVGLHLALVELYDARGWGVLADEKLDLVTTLAGLDAGAADLERIEAARLHRG